MTVRRPRHEPLQRLDQPETCAYLAGLLDAAGGRIGINRAQLATSAWPSHTLRVSHQTTHQPLLDWLAGLGGTVRLANAYRGSSAASYKWMVTGANAGALVAAVRPYLVNRLEQADVALALRETEQNGRPLTERIVTRRQRLKDYLDALNAREVAS